MNHRKRTASHKSTPGRKGTVNHKMTNSQLIGFISFLLLWELLYLAIGTHAIPAPADTILYAFGILKELALHALASLARVLAAVGISLLLGIPAGVFLGVSPLCRRLFSPLLYFIYPIPKVAFLPVFMLLFGLGNPSKIILMIFIIIFQMILSVRDGVDQIPPMHFKVMKSFCATAGQEYRYLILPAILPQVFSGLRIGIGISLASLFFAENYATSYGIGYLIMSAWTKMNYEEMFSGILVLGFVGLLLFQALDRLEAHCTPWK